jgi:ADP-ribose pyrophosphatase YjhB (NUDIX family)
MKVRLEDRRKRAKRGGQLWRHLRAAVRLVVRHPLMSVTVVPVRDDGRIVLARRVDSDRWVLPGGLMDWGETVRETALRELGEETGLEAVRTGRLVGVYSAPDRDPRSHSITVVVEVEVRGEPRTGDPLEISEIQAFAPSELPFGHMVLGSDAMLRDYLEGRTVIA